MGLPKGFFGLDERKSRSAGSHKGFRNAWVLASFEKSPLEKSPQDWSIPVVGKSEEPDNYEYDYETVEEHWLDEEDLDYEIIATRTWPGHFQAPIFMLYASWEHMSAPELYAEDYVHVL